MPLLPPRTPRLRFAWWEDDDNADSHAHTLYSSEAVTKFIGGPWSKREINKRMDNEFVNRTSHDIQYWPLFRRDDGAFVGCCGLRPRRAATTTKTFELGFHLLDQYWGQGLALEAASNVIAHAFDALGATAVYAGPTEAFIDCLKRHRERTSFNAALWQPKWDGALLPFVELRAFLGWLLF